ncbi:glycosyltransferase family 4 protein [Candidatus Woesearchaeota archaeon]|nr:glycosyltransferase family 4 protein [Candidatus Woesearchaeota archaeon]
MKICIITEYYPHEGKITGGAESRVWNLSRELSKRHNVHIICTRQPGQPKKEEYSNIQVHRVGPMIKYTNNISIMKRILFSISAVQKSLQLDYDIIEGASFLSYMPAGISGVLKRKPRIATYHEVWIDKWTKVKGIRGIFGEIWEATALLIPWTNIISVSEYTKKKLSRRGIHTVAVVPNGIQEVRSEKKEERKKEEILCISRLTKQKRVDTLLHAIALLKKQRQRIHCTIIGQGDEREALEHLALELNIKNNVKFLGYVEEKKIVEDYLATATIYCSPSTLEGFGITLLEAYAHGTPAIITKIPAYFEVTKGKGALFFSQGNTEECAQQIHNILTNKKQWGRLSTEAYEHSKKYHWNKIVKLVEEVYGRSGRRT